MLKLEKQGLMQELEKRLQNIAAKYCRKALNISFEDMCQELWCTVIEKDLDSIALAQTIMVNKALDVVRNDIKSNAGVFDTDMQDPITEIKIQHAGHFNEMYDEVEIYTIVKEIPTKRERNFAIATAYLRGGMECFKKAFEIMMEELDENTYQMYQDKVLNDRKDITDDVILRIFCGIKTGSNSGTARFIKNNCKRYLRENL